MFPIDAQTSPLQAFIALILMSLVGGGALQIIWSSLLKIQEHIPFLQTMRSTWKLGIGFAIGVFLFLFVLIVVSHRSSGR